MDLAQNEAVLPARYCFLVMVVVPSVATPRTIRPRRRFLEGPVRLKAD